MTPRHLVVMGVAGCGKSAVGGRIAQSLGLPLIEGDRVSSAGQRQFEMLQDPAGEAGVLVIDAGLPQEEVARRAVAWLAGQFNNA